MGAVTVYNANNSLEQVHRLNGFDIVGGGLNTAHKAVEQAVDIVKDVATGALIKAAENKGYGDEAGKVLNAVKYMDDLTVPANNVVETLSVIPAAAGALTAFTQTTVAAAVAAKVVFGAGTAGLVCANAAPLAGLAAAVVTAYAVNKGFAAVGNVVNYVGVKGYEFGSRIVSEATKNKEVEATNVTAELVIELD